MSTNGTEKAVKSRKLHKEEKTARKDSAVALHEDTVKTNSGETAKTSVSKNTAGTEEKKLDKQTRKEMKQKQKEEKRKKKKPRRRIFPIWLRIIVVLLLAAGALVSGLMIGYGIIGDGNPTDALKKETWQHIIDIVVKVK